MHRSKNFQGTAHFQSKFFKYVTDEDYCIVGTTGHIFPGSEISGFDFKKPYSIELVIQHCRAFGIGALTSLLGAKLLDITGSFTPAFLLAGITTFIGLILIRIIKHLHNKQEKI